MDSAPRPALQRQAAQGISESEKAKVVVQPPSELVAGQGLEPRPPDI